MVLTEKVIFLINHNEFYTSCILQTTEEQWEKKNEKKKCVLYIIHDNNVEKLEKLVVKTPYFNYKTYFKNQPKKPLGKGEKKKYTHLNASSKD